MLRTHDKALQTAAISLLALASRLIGKARILDGTGTPSINGALIHAPERNLWGQALDRKHAPGQVTYITGQ